jgi:hypothetical protein
MERIVVVMALVVLGAAGVVGGGEVVLQRIVGSATHTVGAGLSEIPALVVAVPSHSVLPKSILGIVVNGFWELEHICPESATAA